MVETNQISKQYAARVYTKVIAWMLPTVAIPFESNLLAALLQQVINIADAHSAAIPGSSTLHCSEILMPNHNQISTEHYGTICALRQPNLQEHVTQCNGCCCEMDGGPCIAAMPADYMPVKKISALAGKILISPNQVLLLRQLLTRWPNLSDAAYNLKYRIRYGITNTGNMHSA
jgi:hypothetical protein